MQRIVLEPGVLSKSFQLLFTIRYSQRKALPLTSSHLTEPCRGIFDRALILCYNCDLLHTRTITHSDTVAALYNCLLPLSATRLFPMSKAGFAILLKGTSPEDVKGAESLSHSISPHRFSQLVWDWERRPCRNKLSAEPPGHCPTVPLSPDCDYRVHRKDDTWHVCINVCVLVPFHLPLRPFNVLGGILDKLNGLQCSLIYPPCSMITLTLEWTNVQLYWHWIHGGIFVSKFQLLCF